jgi:hypothetical protein
MPATAQRFRPGARIREEKPADVGENIGAFEKMAEYLAAKPETFVADTAAVVVHRLADALAAQTHDGVLALPSTWCRGKDFERVLGEDVRNGFSDRFRHRHDAPTDCSRTR